MTTPTKPKAHHTHACIKTRRTKPRITWINVGPCQALHQHLLLILLSIHLNLMDLGPMGSPFLFCIVHLEE